MTAEPSHSPYERAILLGVLIPSLGWQFYVVAAVFFKAPIFQALFSELGAELPLMSQLMFLTYRGWVVVPIACAVLTIRAIRNRNTTPLQFGVLAGVCLSGAFLLGAWFIEAVFRPMNALIGKVGN